METLSVFCVGTSHTSQEEWTLMRALFDLTYATEVAPADLDTRIENSQHARVILDGAEILSHVNEYFERQSERVITFITNNNPATIILFGHSRGAALATTIAARMYSNLGARQGQEIFLWMLDTVAMWDPVWFNSTGRNIALRAHPNVSEIVRIVMEDDSNPLFPLEELEIELQNTTVYKDYNYVRETLNRDPAVTLMRMPGTHGTGTQVNRRRQRGDRLGSGGIESLRWGDAWPIGEVCLLHALDSLAHWGAPLKPKVRDFRDVPNDHSDYAKPSARHLLRSYFRVKLDNVRSKSGPISVNDCKKSGSKDIQEIKDASGSEILRPLSRLLNYGNSRIDYRFNRLIVNDHHYSLLRDLFPPDIPQHDFAITMREAGVNEELKIEAPVSDYLLDNLRRLRSEFVEGYLAVRDYRLSDDRRVLDAVEA